MTHLSSRLLALRLFFTPRTVFYSLLFAFAFFLLASVLANIKNTVSILSAPYSLFVKAKLLGIILFQGPFSSMAPIDVWFLVITALLFGLNMGLVLAKIGYVKKGGRLSVVFGTGVLSIVSAGCASCGLSLASLLGLGGAFALLPFHGIELYVLSIGILLVSLYINLGTFAKACKITAV